MPTKEKTTDHLLARLVVLLALLFTLDLWATRHLGIGIANPAWLAGGTAALGTLYGALSKLPSKTERTKLAKWIYAELQRVILATPTLVVLGLVVALVTLTCSSVTLIPEQSQNHVKGCLWYVDAPHHVKEFDEDGPVRRIVITNPFGRGVHLQVERYLLETITVYPLTGCRVRVDRDLRHSPGVLFRPPWSALRSLENGGCIKVWRTDLEKPLLVAQDPNYRGSFLLGNAQAIPSSYLGNWQWELRAAAVPDRDAARTLLEWRTPRVLPQDPSLHLAPGMTLRAEVLSHGKALQAQATVTLGDESLVDVPMLDKGD
jgi:hypothetical protein